MNLKICLILSIFIYSSFSVFLPAVYQQCDPRWKDFFIGFGSKTICENGSLLTSVASIVSGLHLNQGNEMVNPLQMNEWLKKNGGFQPSDHFVWDSLTPFGLKFEKISMDINEILDAFAEEKVMIIQVVQGKEHYVVPEAIISGAFVMMDPQAEDGVFYKLSDIFIAAIYKWTPQSILM